MADREDSLVLAAMRGDDKWEDLTEEESLYWDAIATETQEIIARGSIPDLPSEIQSL